MFCHIMNISQVFCIIFCMQLHRYISFSKKPNEYHCMVLKPVSNIRAYLTVFSLQMDLNGLLLTDTRLDLVKCFNSSFRFVT